MFLAEHSGNRLVRLGVKIPTRPTLKGDNVVNKKALGAYLKDLRTSKTEKIELSLRSVAEKCKTDFDVKISHEQVRQIEEGIIRDPGAEKIGALARVYNVDPMDLISRIEKKA